MTEKSGQDTKGELAHKQGDSPEEAGGSDEVPGDIRAFYGHPLANGEDTHASALALLHEYQNLPAIDRSDEKVGDKFDGLSEILRHEEETKPNSGSDYSMLLTSDVDAFLNRNSKAEAIKALEASPRNGSSRLAMSTEDSRSPLLASPRHLKVANHGSPSPSKCFPVYEQCSSPSNDSITSDSLTTSLKIVEDIDMVENRSAPDETTNNSEESQQEPPEESKLPKTGKDIGSYEKEAAQVVCDENVSSKHVQSQTSYKARVKQKPVKLEAGSKPRSILAQALTGGQYKPAARSSSVKVKSGHLLTSKPDVIPPPPPYQKPPHSGTVQNWINLPPVSAICQQIEKDHPQMADVPLAIIKKSLFALGFPASGDIPKKDEPTHDKADDKVKNKGIVHSLLVNSSRSTLHSKASVLPTSSSSTAGITSSTASVYSRSLATEKNMENMDKVKPKKKATKRKKQTNIQCEPLNVTSSHSPNANVSTTTNHMRNNELNSVSNHQLTQQTEASVSVSKPISSIEKVQNHVTSTTPIIKCTTHVSKNYVDTAISLASTNPIVPPHVKPATASETVDKQQLLQTKFPETKTVASKNLDREIGNNSVIYSQNSTCSPSNMNVIQSVGYAKMTELSNTPTSVSMNSGRLHPLQRSLSCGMDKSHALTHTLTQSHGLDKVEPPTPLNTSSPVSLDPKPNVTELTDYASTSNSFNQSPLQYLTAPYPPSLPTDESQLLSHLLGGTVLRPPGNGPASHIIVPKSVFHMATQRLCFPFAANNVQEYQQGAPLVTTNSQSSVSSPIVSGSQRPNLVHSKSEVESVRPHLLHAASMNERSRQNFVHSKSMVESARPPVLHSTSLDEDTNQYFTHSKYVQEIDKARQHTMESASADARRESQQLMQVKSTDDSASQTLPCSKPVDESARKYLMHSKSSEERENARQHFMNLQLVQENGGQHSMHSPVEEDNMTQRIKQSTPIANTPQHVIYSSSIEDNTRQNLMPAKSEADGSKQREMLPKSADETITQLLMHPKSVKQQHLTQYQYPNEHGKHPLKNSRSVDNTPYLMPVNSLQGSVTAAENLTLHRRENTGQSLEACYDSDYISQSNKQQYWDQAGNLKRPSSLPVCTASMSISQSSQMYTNSTMQSPDTVFTQYSDVSDSSSGRQSAPLFEQGHSNADNLSRSLTSTLVHSNSMSAPTTPVCYAVQNYHQLPIDSKHIPNTQSALDQLNAYANQMSMISACKSTLSSKNNLMGRAMAHSMIPTVDKNDFQRSQTVVANTGVLSNVTISHPVSIQTGHQDSRYPSQALVSSSGLVAIHSDNVAPSSSSSTHNVRSSIRTISSNSQTIHSMTTPAVNIAGKDTLMHQITDKVIPSKKLTTAWIDKSHKDSNAKYAEPISQRGIGRLVKPAITGDIEMSRTPKHHNVAPPLRHSWDENQYTPQNEPLQTSFVKDEDQSQYCDNNQVYTHPYDLSIAKTDAPLTYKVKPGSEESNNNNQFGNNVLVIRPQSGPTTPPNVVHTGSSGNSLHAGYPHELKSPDSGYNESCVSPSENAAAASHNHHSEYMPVRATSSIATSDLPGDKIQQQAKRQRSVSLVRPSQDTATLPERRLSRSFTIPKLEPSQCCYRCYLETPISASQKVDEDKMTYLNKGQYYNLVLEYKGRSRPPPAKSVKSRVMVVFREEKCVQDEYRAWEFWYSRQHSNRQRVIELDAKNSSGILSNSIEDTSHNCVSFRWNPLEQNAKVSVSISCLSTDFSNQKGVKGLPLHVEVDTFERDHDTTPVHRSYCQIKVFCDKGAERKARDEERKKETKSKESGKSMKKKAETKLHPVCEISEFYHRADLMKQPVLYTPAMDTEEATVKIPYVMPAPKALLSPHYITSGDEPDVVPCKRPRKLSREAAPQSEKVLLYVRGKSDEVFTALLLLTPTMNGLAHAIEEKYSIPAAKIRNVYKRSQKGVLVKMDDNIIRHYSNEATFLITIQHLENSAQDSFDVTLLEVDAN